MKKANFPIHPILLKVKKATGAKLKDCRDAVKKSFNLDQAIKFINKNIKMPLSNINKEESKKEKKLWGVK